MTSERLTARQVADAGLDGWALLLGGLQTRIHTPNFATGLSLVAAIGAAAEAADHHPDVDLRFRHVDVRLTSHDVGGVTGRDVRLARTVSGLAGDAGLRPDVAGVSRLELALDTPDHRAVLPFWAAALGMEHRSAPDLGDEVHDPAGSLPTLWFQPAGREEPRQRWHLDVAVDPSQAKARIDAALAAGGTLVSDAEAPAFWVLADADGNRMCVCTWQGRD